MLGKVRNGSIVAYRRAVAGVTGEALTCGSIVTDMPEVRVGGQVIKGANHAVMTGYATVSRADDAVTSAGVPADGLGSGQNSLAGTVTIHIGAGGGGSSG